MQLSIGLGHAVAIHHVFARVDDYRALFGGLFARMYGLNAARLQSVFPGAPARDFALV